MLDIFLNILFYTGILFLFVIVGGLCLVFYLARCYDKSEARKNVEKKKLENTRKTMIETPHVVSISPNNLYARTPEALKALLQELETKGYKIKDCRKDERRDAPIEVQEKNGWYLWYASLDLPKQGVCYSCGAHISTSGIWTHEHQCEACGEFTYLKFTSESTIRFYFINKEKQDRVSYEPIIKMKIYGYDKETSSLLLHAEPCDGNNFSDWKKEKAEEVLRENEDKIRRLTAEDGTPLIAIKYDPNAHEYDVMGCVDISPNYHNAKIVTVYEGKDYSEYGGDLPIRESYVIYEAWHWAPICGPSPHLHEKIMSAAGLVSRCDYYYQDGRPAFDGIHYQRMRTFVQHFTDIDLRAWDILVKNAPRSGPGFIRFLAAYCQGVPPGKEDVVDEPNMGNVLEGLSKILSGRSLSNGELHAFRRSVKDPEIRQMTVNLWGAIVKAGVRNVP
jgi:hypothetical protein